MDEADTDLRSRWRGQSGRLEVWYTTLTDPATGIGVWIHHELVAPTNGDAPWGHGWIAVVEPGLTPVLRRFGPEPWPRPAVGFACGEVTYDGRLVGRAGEVAWELTSTAVGPTLYTFPRWAWRHELLPAAQVVPRPTARYSGTVRLGARELVLRDVPGADARIYGHGNAERWGWLHADLGGGEVVEVVAAVSTRPVLNLLPPLPMVRFRLTDGNRTRDWPAGPWAAVLGLRTRLHPDGFEIRGRVGRRGVRISVELPERETVEVDYVDPDGTALVCRNSLRARASIELRRGHTLERGWVLDHVAHAEVGGFRG